MSIAISQDGYQTVDVDYLFDHREKSNVSYPSSVYGINVDGSYNGKIYVTYDNGRGTYLDPSTITTPVRAELRA